MTQQPESEEFYTELFTKSADWSTTYPNAEEARRAARILPLLSQVAEDHRARAKRPLHILDLGCGRGWLTYMADMYGECLGVDPVKPVIDFAKTRYPHLSFKVGTAEDLLRDGDSSRFDVVIASEVIEHVAPEKHSCFVEAIRSLLRQDGAVIVSSDRGELYQRWTRRGGTDQPVEAWLTERQLQELFTRHGFRVIQHDRVNYDQPQLSLLHRIVASERVSHIVTRTRQQWLLEALRFLSAECQVWLFRLPK